MEGFNFGWSLGLLEAIGVLVGSMAERVHGGEGGKRVAPFRSYVVLAGLLGMSSSLSNMSLNYIKYPTKVTTVRFFRRRFFCIFCIFCIIFCDNLSNFHLYRQSPGMCDPPVVLLFSKQRTVISQLRATSPVGRMLGSTRWFGGEKLFALGGGRPDHLGVVCSQ